MNGGVRWGAVAPGGELPTRQGVVLLRLQLKNPAHQYKTNGRVARCRAWLPHLNLLLLTCGGGVLPGQPEPAGKALPWWARELPEYR